MQLFICSRKSEQSNHAFHINRLDLHFISVHFFSLFWSLTAFFWELPFMIKTESKRANVTQWYYYNGSFNSNNAIITTMAESQFCIYTRSLHWLPTQFYSRQNEMNQIDEYEYEDKQKGKPNKKYQVIRRLHSSQSVSLSLAISLSRRLSFRLLACYHAYLHL